MGVATWPLPPMDPITPIAFSFPNSVPAAPMVKSGLQRREITELFKDAGAPLRNLFLTELVRGMSSGSSKGG